MERRHIEETIEAADEVPVAGGAFGNHRRGQGHDGEVGSREALSSEHQQTSDGCHHRREQDGGNQTRQAGIAERREQALRDHRHGVGADAEEDGLSKAEQAGLPPAEGKAHGEDAVGDDLRHLGQAPLIDGQRDDGQEQPQANREHRAATRWRHLIASRSSGPAGRAG
jgi:hypothetical protein